jgi:hypothetical protein
MARPTAMGTARPRGTRTARPTVSAIPTRKATERSRAAASNTRRAMRSAMETPVPLRA